MKSSDDRLIIQVVFAHTFRCTQCGKATETVKLFPKGVRCPYPITAPERAGTLLFHNESEAVMILPEVFPLLKDALEKGAAAALYQLQPLWISTYCPKCQACYCKQHWKMEDRIPSWGDPYSWDVETFGICPKGHERKMAD